MKTPLVQTIFWGMIIIIISLLTIFSVSAAQEVFDDMIVFGNINGTNLTAAFFCNASGSCHSVSEFLSSGSGDITAVNTNGPYLLGGATFGDANLLINESYLNITIAEYKEHFDKEKKKSPE